MNVYVCTDHDGHYVGGASVVVARDEDEARALLNTALRAEGLNGSDRVPYTLELVDTATPGARVLQNGDY